MVTIITVCSEKGGVGKTTVSLNLALSLAEKRKRVLLVDLDPQGGIGHSLARGDAEFAGLADVLMAQVAVADAITQTKLPELSLLTRGRLDPLDSCEFEIAISSPGVLRGVLEQAKASFDYVLLDTPSGLGLVTRAALRASDFVVLPSQAEPLGLRSISRTLRVLDRVRSTENENLRLLGILPTMVDKNSEPSQTVMMEMWTGFEGVFDTIIPRAEVFADASLRGVPVGYLPGPVSPEARRFEVLAAEVEALIWQLGNRKGVDLERTQRTLL